MAGQTIPKMSLVAQYDDLCRYAKILTSGSEEKFKIFLESQLDCLHKWKEVKSDVQKLQDKISSLESDKRRLETQIKHLKILCEDERVKRRKAEMEKNSMETQIAIIKEVLLTDCVMDNQTKEKLGFLNSESKQNSPPRLETIEESESIDFLLDSCDTTEDDLENIRQSSRHNGQRSKGKRSSSESRLSLKKKKFSNNEQSEDMEVENVSTPYKVSEVRSNSEPTYNSPEHPPIVYGHRSDSDQYRYNTYDSRRYNTGCLSGGTPNGRYSTGGKLSRSHSFVQKTVIRTEKCFPCGKILKFCKQALKCQDCRVICHPECKDQCPVPCIPAVCTPTKCGPGSIADYTSSAAPMIPSLIVHCVNEIETRGFNEIGLYRISGSEREVKDLKEKFIRGRSIPCLTQIDIHAICCTIKEFLRSLKEPLIPRSAWQAFVDAANIKDSTLSLNTMYENVMELPQPNRDTLAFMILHLQRVAESPNCKMPVVNLAKVFGPTIVGYSVPDPVDTHMFSETGHQFKVMECLLSIPVDSWQSLLNFEPDVFTGSLKTPENLPAPSQSTRLGHQTTRLGPLYAPGHKAKTMTLGKTPPIHRNSPLKYSKRGKTHFSSPLLK